RTRSDAVERWALTNAATFGPRPLTASSLDSKSNTATLRAGGFANAGAAPATSVKMVMRVLSFIIRGSLSTRNGWIKAADRTANPASGGPSLTRPERQDSIEREANWQNPSPAKLEPLRLRRFPVP